jgi:hypothetical protein
MCSHVPNKGEQMVRYYGYYSNVSRGKRKMLEKDELIPSVLETDDLLKERRKNWARLIQKIYEVDLLTCPKCSGEMKVISVVFVLSIGVRHLNTNNKFLVYGNEAVLPFYLFHQTIILCVGWYVIRWDMGILIKLLIIAVVSFALIMIPYELFVRRFNIVRFFFGMRPKKKPSVKPVPGSEGISA